MFNFAADFKRDNLLATQNSSISYKLNHKFCEFAEKHNNKNNNKKKRGQINWRVA